MAKATTKKKVTKKHQSISLLLYGDAGVGKSVVASTFPKCLYLDFDQGTKVYRSKFPDNKYLTYQDGDLFTFLKEAIKQVKAGTFKYDTIVIDSLTNVENKTIARYRGVSPDNWDTALYRDLRKLDYDNWGSLSGSTTSLMTYLRDLPVNSVIITQVGFKDEMKYPQLIGKGKTEATHFADYLGFMTASREDDKTVRHLHFSAGAFDKFIAKGRFAGEVPEAIKNPNYNKIIDLIENYKGEFDFSD